MKQNAVMTVVPKKVEDLRQRLEQWRRTHKRRGRIPETLWAEAAALARLHGVYQTARALRLEYTRLWYWSQQQREPAGRAVDESGSARPAEFVELVAGTAGQPECVIEWESKHGKVTIHLKGSLPDLSELSRAFWRQS
jgi:hypothetical protein